MPALNPVFQRETQKLFNRNGLVELFHLDATNINGLNYRFTNYIGVTGGSVQFNGVVYNPLPIRLEGLDSNSTGTLPKPVITLGNSSKVMLGAVLQYGDLVGAFLYYTRTYSHFLDGQPNANTQAKRGPEKWRVEQMINRDSTVIQWSLATDLDKMGFRFGRQILKDQSAKHVYAPGVARSRVKTP